MFVLYCNEEAEAVLESMCKEQSKKESFTRRTHFPLLLFSFIPLFINLFNFTIVFEHS